MFVLTAPKDLEKRKAWRTMLESTQVNTYLYLRTNMVLLLHKSNVFLSSSLLYGLFIVKILLGFLEQ